MSGGRSQSEEIAGPFDQLLRESEGSTFSKDPKKHQTNLGMKQIVILLAEENMAELRISTVTLQEASQSGSYPSQGQLVNVTSYSESRSVLVKLIGEKRCQVHRCPYCNISFYKYVLYFLHIYIYIYNIYIYIYR